MPLYEYECAKCGEKIEVIRSFSDPPLVVCPECGGALTKLLSSPAFQFKGSGFYLTDYGKSGSAGDRAGEKAEEKKDKEKSSSKGEEGKAPSASGGGEAAGGGEKKKEASSKGKKDGGSDAAPSSPAAPPSPAPSKKNPKGDTK
jgi:putative FmdB family regulatory protein